MENEKPVNILLVDDQPANLLALEAVLESLGQNLVRANSGEEALRHLIQKDFAVILLDVLMPGMNGFETAALIRDRDRSRHTPVIFLTAGGKTETEMFQGYAVGAIDYLLKPIRPAVLKSKVLFLMNLYRKTEEVNRLNDELVLRAKEIETLNQMVKTENELRKKAEEKLRLCEEALKDLEANGETKAKERGSHPNRTTEELAKKHLGGRP